MLSEQRDRSVLSEQSWWDWTERQGRRRWRAIIIYTRICVFVSTHALLQVCNGDTQCMYLKHTSVCGFVALGYAFSLQ